jgi:curved DNA-binding protein CbpA
MLEYHPDRVSNLGEELQALAEEKSKAINEAYRRILDRGAR